MKRFKRAMLMPWAGGAAPAFSPLNVAGLQGWYKADALALNNNDPVSSWTDSSGLAHHLVQGTGSLQPLYKTNQVNGLPSILFDGSDDFLRTGAFTLAWPVTMFIVFQQTTWTTGDRICDGKAASASLTMRQTGSSPNIQVVGTLGAPTIAGPVEGGAFGLVKSIWNGATSALALNNAADTTGDCGTTATNADGVTLGATAAGISTSNINVAELLVYNTVVSAGDQTLIKTYLNTKYVLF